MNNTKHSPAPWYIDAGRENERGDYCLRDTDGDFVAWFRAAMTTPEQRKRAPHNATLAVAAPALAEALLDMLSPFAHVKDADLRRAIARGSIIPALRGYTPERVLTARGALSDAGVQL